jgi:hypothetical protein
LIVETGERPLSSAAAYTVERRDGEVRSAHHRQQIARLRIDSHERGLQIASTNAPQAIADGDLGSILDLGDERRVDLPVRRVVAAVDVAELLPQKFLRVAVTRARHRRERLDLNALGTRRLLLPGGDLLFLAHALQHDETAPARGIEMRPRRVRRRCADDAGDERRLAEREIGRRLPEHLPRHRLDAVDTAAQVDAIEIQLQDLALRQKDLEHRREHRFLQLAAVGPGIREVQCAGKLLRDRAAALRAVGSQVVERRTRQRDGIDARMQVETVIFNGDHRVLEIGGDLLERHVAPLLVETEPRPVRGIVEDRVANAAVQAVNRPGMPYGPIADDDRDQGGDDAESDLHPPRNGWNRRNRQAPDRRQSEFGQPHLYEW